jgi:hypothetical protein
MTAHLDRVQEARQHLSPMSPQLVRYLCDALVTELGEGADDLEHDAMKSLQEGNYDRAKQLCLMNPTNSYLAAISCISSAYRSPTVADSVLRDAARHTAAVAARKCEQRISAAFSAILAG